MEPENHLFEMENHLNQTFMFVFKMLIFTAVPFISRFFKETFGYFVSTLSLTTLMTSGRPHGLQEHGRGQTQCDEAGDPKSQLSILKDLDKKHQKKGSPAV